MRFRWRRFVVVALLCLSISAATASAEYHYTSSQVRRALVKVRKTKNLEKQANAAEHLSEMFDHVDPRTIDDQTLNDLISLLDTPEEVRGWIAGTLGLLGPRAKAAIPKLLSVLPEADCVQGELTSSAAIKLALIRLGARPPFPTCSEK